MTMGAKENKRLLWRSRRGVRELDSLLVPYAQIRIKVMDRSEKHVFKLLLEQQDPDLLDWLLGRRRPESDLIAAAVDNVLRFNAEQEGLESPISFGANEPI